MPADPHCGRIARDLGLPPARVEAAIDLLDGGNTVPFIARYRKEATGSLDEAQVRLIEAAIARWRALDARRRTVLDTIEAQGKLTDELRSRIVAADSMAALEDLYRPYKPKRRTRAAVAREKGLQGLADLIVAQPRSGDSAETIASPYIGAAVPTPEDALAGARDIVAELIAEDATVRGRSRELALQHASLRSQRSEAAEDPRQVYGLYYDFRAAVRQILPHQVLAAQRGESQKVLAVRIDIPEHCWREAIAARYRPDARSPLAAQLQAAIEDGALRLLLPAIERDVRRHLKSRSEAHAIGVFARNLRGLLMQPPLAGHRTMGIDPGFRTGCKAAIVDTTGKVVDTATIYPHQPHGRWQESLAELARLVERHGVSLIAIGNGTASRETEQLVATLIGEGAPVQYLLASEAGASVYSASQLARSELPDLDVTMRGAVSIARRVQDPLAELVKIDARSIGVGMYQHDVDQSALGEALDSVVESVVNYVGVEANTASAALLGHVAGIGPKLAERIVAHRDANGPFRNREALRAVPGLGRRAFEQSAGFLRIGGGHEPLDETAIHPESYAVARQLLDLAGLGPEATVAERQARLRELAGTLSAAELAAALDVGLPTLQDILEQLARPGRDPRRDLPAPILRTDVLSIEDLRPGMVLAGTVRNVVDFGAFIDIGVKQDALLHRSRMPRGLVLSVGEVVEIAVERIEAERGRIGLAWPGA
jgi:uncharacterized protein